MAIDEARVEQMAGLVGSFMTGSAMCIGMWLGDKLGIYQAMKGAGPLKSDDVATKTNTHPRLIREWLDSQAAAGLLEYDEDADTYELTPEGAMALADEDSPMFVSRAMSGFASIFQDIDKIADAFRSPSGGMSWGDHNHLLFQATEWFFRPGYRTFLTSEWLPALEGVVDKLDNGAKVADVGCGFGASAIAMAERFPASHFYGFDFHGPSIEQAKERAKEHGVSGNTSFATADAKGYDGTYDLVCFFDCLHDMGDPVGNAKHALEHLAPDGTLLLVEPFALADRVANIRENPMAPMMYMFSSTICTPNSLSQEVGAAIGTAAGPETLRRVLTEAGFTRFRVAAETPMNLIIEARP